MENGLFMPDQAIVDGEPAKGKVIAVGAEVKQVKEGDILLWDRKNYAQTVVFDTQKYALLRESMAFGVLED
jgi:co-chaperonin GroES (HSP10)